MIGTLIGAAQESPVVKQKPSELSAPALTGNAVGGIGGALLWRSHPWLGLFSGIPVGGGAAQIATGHAADGFGHLLFGAITVVGSKLWRKHPVGGWWLGAAAGLVASGVIAKVTKK